MSAKQLLSLGLKFVKIHGDKVPDEWFEKFAYFREPAREVKAVVDKARHGDRSHKRAQSKAEPRGRGKHRDNGRRESRARRRSNDDAAVAAATSTAPQQRAADKMQLVADAPARYKDAPPHAPDRLPVTTTTTSPLAGYHDGPAPDFVSPLAAAATVATAPRLLANSDAPAPLTARSLHSSTAHMTSPPRGQEYYPPPPPQGDDYGRQRYNPANYQPSDYTTAPRTETMALQAPRSTYSDDRYGRAASADPTGRYSQYDGYDGRADRYDRYDDRDDRYEDRDSRRSKSRSRRSRSRSTERSRLARLEEHFDVSQKGLGAGALGAIAGGLIAHKFGKTPLATGAGVVLGGLGANAWEAHSRNKHSKDHYREKELMAMGGRSRSIDPASQSRRGIEYYDDERPSRGRYDDEYSDEEYEEARRRRRDSRRRRRSDGRDDD